MAWERQGNRLYYYRSRRVGRRVVREFYGGGIEAELAAALDQERQQRRQAERRSRVQSREVWESASRTLHELIAVSTMLSHATLLAGGYHRHQSEWRKRRVHDNAADGSTGVTNDRTTTGVDS